MKTTSSCADLAALTLPTLAWLTAWQVMTAAPMAAAASQSPRKPSRKPSRKPARKRRRAVGANVIQFPGEKAARRPAVIQSGTAKIIPLPKIA